jgi:hypothetical protein
MIEQMVAARQSGVPCLGSFLTKPENVALFILLLRGEKVLLSQHVAQLYGVSVSALNQAVKRNSGRFPEDFMFQLSDAKFESLKSQIVSSNRGGPHRALPYAFTEQGIAMLLAFIPDSPYQDAHFEALARSPRRTRIRLKRVPEARALLRKCARRYSPV